jgi:serine/threonine protein kinase
LLRVFVSSNIPESGKHIVSSVFREAALQSKLVSSQQLREAMVGVVRNVGRSMTVDEIDDKDLASVLVEMNVITAYQADQLIAGRTKLKLGAYIITDWIGQGGMGQVFKAVHEMLGRECAIKVLPLQKSNPESIANFRREIRTQAQLNHPNLVQAYDAGEDGSVHFLVVEYVPGTDLRRLVRTKGHLDVQQAANVIQQAAEGLAHAHSHNLIHRDIKPGNILVTPDGVAKLSDLGLAGFMHDPDDPRAGKTVGTADYLSPELIRNPGEATRVSDIYSLGCTLYYSITGKVPFPGGTPKSKARRHLEETPWHPRRFNEDVTDEFVDLIGDMMEKDPQQRIQTALEVAERLAPWASDASPLLGDAVGRSRWQPAPTPFGGQQDTDPANDVAAMAMTEIGGISETSHGWGSMSDSPATATPPPPPITQSLVGQYRAAGRVDGGEPLVTINTAVVIGVACLLGGLVAGFLIGKFA